MSRRVAAGLVATTLLVAVGGCGGAGDILAQGDEPTSSSSLATAPPATTPPTAAPSGVRKATDADFAAIRDVLDARSRALSRGDLSAFLETLDRSDPTFVAGQRTYFANVQVLPVRSVRYRMENYALTPATVQHADQVLRPDVSELVFLPGTDEHPMSKEVGYTFVRRGDRWLLGADESGPSGNEEQVDSRPWAGEAIAVAQRGPLVVVVDRTEAATLDELVDEVRSDLQSVSSFLHQPLDLHILVDATTTGRTSRVDQLGEGNGTAAAAVTYAVGGTSGIAGWRIKINPTDVTGALGQTGLLRHELTHFVLRDIDSGAPTWVSEGVAEVAGYWPTQFWQQVVPAAYYEQLMEAPRELPQTPYWSNHPDVNYPVARAAVDHLVLTYGVPELIRFMKAYRGQGGLTADDSTAKLLRRVYGTTEAKVVAGAFDLLRQFHH